MSIIQPRTARVVIYQGDDLARLQELDRKAIEAEEALIRAERNAAKPNAGGARLMSDEPAEVTAKAARDEAVAQRDTFAAEAEDRGVLVVLHSLPRKEWRALRNAHPPRDGNSEDEGFDCNIDSLPDQALPPSIDRDQSTIEGDLNEFLDSLTHHDYYQRLFMTVLALNVGGAGADPKLRIGSDATPTSSATSS